MRHKLLVVLTACFFMINSVYALPHISKEQLMSLNIQTIKEQLKLEAHAIKSIFVVPESESNNQYAIQVELSQNAVKKLRNLDIVSAAKIKQMISEKFQITGFTKQEAETYVSALRMQLI